MIDELRSQKGHIHERIEKWLEGYVSVKANIAKYLLSNAYGVI